MERVLIEKEVWMKMWGKDDAGYNTTDDIKRYKENKKTKKKERQSTKTNPKATQILELENRDF